MCEGVVVNGTEKILAPRPPPSRRCSPAQPSPLPSTLPDQSPHHQHTSQPSPHSPPVPPPPPVPRLSLRTRQSIGHALLLAPLHCVRVGSGWYLQPPPVSTPSPPSPVGGLYLAHQLQVLLEHHQAQTLGVVRSGEGRGRGGRGGEGVGGERKRCEGRGSGARGGEAVRGERKWCEGITFMTS